MILKYELLGMSKLRSHAMNKLYQLPLSLNYFIEKGSVYYKLNKEIEDDLLYARQPHIEHDINEFVNEHATKLVECVLVSSKPWILVTQFEAYVSNQPHIDDCAFSQPGLSSATPTAHIIDKNRFQTTWKEIRSILDVRLGPSVAYDVNIIVINKELSEKEDGQTQEKDGQSRSQGKEEQSQDDEYYQEEEDYEYEEEECPSEVFISIIIFKVHYIVHQHKALLLDETYSHVTFAFVTIAIAFDNTCNYF
ncbi:hypothetical protein BDA99DRAFT_541451 [Phascolomyces articulosus]|uniref:Uncharacterized protein n=1 Tax=Phascolomyces articulosus TaxID=60185 RepID=A0AAD5PA75_9FUNG|nr:hypothetical protein BDA99DRAFT_541451 [Phascolomyces articulosus]